MRLTPDITVRGRMPTPAEYREHVRLLEDVAAGGRRVFDHWTGKDMSDLQHEVWVAVHQQGLVRQDHAGVHRLTPYGKHYLEQRRGSAKRDPARDGYTRSAARYAKGMILVRAPSSTGLKSRAARLLHALHCRYTNREKGYVCSPAKFAKFERLFLQGWDANFFSDELVAPSARDSIPATRRSSLPPASGVLAPVRGLGHIREARVQGSPRALWLREVVVLLRSQHRVPTEKGVRWVAKWHSLIGMAYASGKTPCSVAEHLVKYEQKKICPCTANGRDCARCKTRRKR